MPDNAEANICETCVTVTWIQLNLQLLRLTGEAKYGDELERTIYNHLAAAQHPRGDDWCYYTALEGRKPYDSGINCCHSSGPRGMALAPQTAYLRRRAADGDTLLVSTFETSQARLALGGVETIVDQKGRFPLAGVSEITFHLKQPAAFAVKVRRRPGPGRLRSIWSPPGLSPPPTGGPQCRSGRGTMAMCCASTIGWKAASSWASTATAGKRPSPGGRSSWPSTNTTIRGSRPL